MVVFTLAVLRSGAQVPNINVVWRAQSLIQALSRHNALTNLPFAAFPWPRLCCARHEPKQHLWSLVTVPQLQQRSMPHNS